MSTLPWWGYALLSALFAALTTIFAKIGVSQISSNLATAIRTAIILIIVWAIVLVTGEVQQLGDVPQRAWLFLILSAVATGLSWLFYFKGLQVGQASLVAPIDKSSVALVLILSALVLGEKLTTQSIAGTLLILVGTLVLIL
jgi:transporter family protein